MANRQHPHHLAPGLPIHRSTRGPALLAAAAALASACTRGGGEPVPRLPDRVDTSAAPAGQVSFVRVNQLGYLPEGRKVAVVCSLEPRRIETFAVEDEAGRSVLGPLVAREAPGFGPCVSTHRLDFSELRAEGRYVIRAGGATSPPVRIARNVYDGAADFLLRYLRQQRSGYNPFFDDSVHEHTDGILVDHPTRAGEFIPVTGGWADAADYLQYITTSANATFNLMLAWRDNPSAFGDAFDADGRPGGNGVPDVLDEARHGLEWLLRMYPEDDLMLHQLGDDRDHAFPDLPTTDSSDYGWGKGGFRPVYPCTGEPQGIVRDRNRSNGMANIAGKYAAAFALGARIFGSREAAFADSLAGRAVAAYELGRENHGVCQTAPGAAPYFYEEENWADDMELGAAELHALTGEDRYLWEAMQYARREPVTPWMGADTALHYQWFPWHNPGHYETWRQGDDEHRALLAGFYRRGLEAVAERADNGFRIGIPFIWCSNNLMTSFATQALLYRRMTGDTAFVTHETAALDWLLGTNPWGTSMIIGLPADGVWPRDPHSIVAWRLGVESQFGGLVDGPVYTSIFESLLGIALRQPDEFAPFNTGHIVYHDDLGDYSTNEPIMDGTANLTYLFAAMASGGG